jgi:tRNA dimethylallyltransferase
LYGFHTVKKKFSTGHWLKIINKKIKNQWKIGKTPIVVGGTGLYFKALTDGLVKIPIIPSKFRDSIKKLHNKLGQNNFYHQLIKLDPLSKKFISNSDVQRSIRAYEVKKFTKKSIFDFIKDTKPTFNKNVFVKIFINTPKEIVHENIKKRVEKMFEDGAIKETKDFFKLKINKELSSNKIIGIREIKGYLEGQITEVEAKELIDQKTRQYAKRQFTWARGHMKSWEMIYSSNINDLFKKIINKIS